MRFHAKGFVRHFASIGFYIYRRSAFWQVCISPFEVDYQESAAAKVCLERGKKIRVANAVWNGLRRGAFK
jgi:hypothetical protein